MSLRPLRIAKDVCLGHASCMHGVLSCWFILYRIGIFFLILSSNSKFATKPNEQLLYGLCLYDAFIFKKTKFVCLSVRVLNELAGVYILFRERYRLVEFMPKWILIEYGCCITTV